MPQNIVATTPAPWGSIKFLDVVYQPGAGGRLFGPYIVDNTWDRWLLNKNGGIFRHYPNDLVKVAIHEVSVSWKEISTYRRETELDTTILDAEKFIESMDLSEEYDEDIQDSWAFRIEVINQLGDVVQLFELEEDDETDAQNNPVFSWANKTYSLFACKEEL